MAASSLEGTMRNFLGLLLGVVLLVGAVPALAVDEPYEHIRVYLPANADLSKLFIHPDLEVVGIGDGDVEFVSRPSLTNQLIQRGWKVDILRPDLEKDFAMRQGALLDYGVWHTYQETIDEMNLLHSQYPNLTTAPVSIGRSGENRDIWAMKISDNPNVQEDEPEVLNDAMHHAREIMTVEVNLYFMRYLCENYGTDPVATFLVDNRQIWFVPLVNVDGFVYNELTNPNGGGYWRKNRRNNGGGCYGVDNNRNYPYEWVGGGSSTNPCDDTYRGPSAGSEPENQALMNLGNAHHFVTHDSWHSFGGMVLIPWGYTTAHTPDDAILRSIANERSRENGYVVGQPQELLYAVNGGSLDWWYGEQTTKPKCYDFSTEVGGSDFWPQTSERAGLIAENMHSIIYLAQVAGPSVSVQSLVVSGGNGKIEPGETVDLLATVKNDGVLSTLTNLSIQLQCNDPYIVLNDASNVIGLLGAGQTWTNTTDPFNVTADAGCPQGRQVTFTVVANAEGGVHMEVPFLFTVGELPVIVADTFESPGDEWSQDGTHTAVTGAFVRVDPVATPQYQPGDDTTPAPGVYAWITAQNPNGVEGTDDVDTGISASRSADYNLSGFASVRLSMNYFHGQRDTGDDAAGDFFRIDVSSDAGGSWVNLLTLGDVARLAAWQNLTAELTDYIALTNQVRFRVQASDAGSFNDIVEGGIDDFYLYNAGSGNAAPNAPVLLSPPNGSPIGSPVTLTVSNSTDPEGDPLTYGFRVYSDADLTVLAASVDGVASGASTTSWQTPAIPLGTYYWRAFAADANQRSVFSITSRFTVTTVGDAGDLAAGARTSIHADPNPTQSGTLIRYMLPATPTSSLAIYDPQGRLVRSLKTVPSASGWHEIVWDGKDDAGRAVSSGSYWVRLWTPGETRTIRVVRID
jgi:hypothetical protein